MQIKLSTGEVVDRSRVCFSMPEFKNHKNYFVDSRGRIYNKDKRGTLRRLKGDDLKNFLAIIAKEVKEQKAAANAV